MPADSILNDLQARGLLDTCTDLESLRERLQQSPPIRAYCGFDPTADSLHVGSLLSLAVLRRFIASGHDAIALVGGFTGMIGDPSGKSQERNLLDLEVLDHNRAALTAQIRELLTVEGREPRIVDNRDWFEGMSALELLRDIGKFAGVKQMLDRDSAKNRLAQGGLSFTEFSYQLLQAHDFAYLRKEIGCELQLGGTDQYGNITAGTDLIRRRRLGPAWGLVWPLLLKADGTKFGKTETGNIWLSGERTSPFAFHQYWLNAADADAHGLLLKFTLRPEDDIKMLMALHERDRGSRLAQRTLADDMTSWVHGRTATATANRVAAALFTGTLDVSDLDHVASAVPTTRISRGELENFQVAQLAARAGLCSSISEARRLIAEGGMYVAGKRVTDLTAPAPTDEPYVVFRRGNRTYVLAVVE